MTCQACGVRFSKTKTDRFEQKAVDSDDLEDQTFCSANCATEFGWYDTEDTFSRTAALLAELLYAVKDAPVSRIFTHRERQSLNDTLAIVSCESGAERKVGPPVTLPLLLAALKKLPTDDLSFWSETLAQLEETVAMLGND